MDTHALQQHVQALISPGKGILAADTSVGSTSKRFEPLGIPTNEETRRLYRQMLLTTPSLSELVSGVILHDETIRQTLNSGLLFADHLAQMGVEPGIKVDEGLSPLPGFEPETITRGLDNLPARLEEYASMGATFTKWRSVITIDHKLPTQEAIQANAYILSQYARYSQDAGLVPFVEPEILFDGDHSIEQCYETMVQVYTTLFETLRAYRVHLPGCILKTSFALPGKASGIQVEAEQVADFTLRAIYDHAPRELGGIVFLSGGLTSEQAFNCLAALHRRHSHAQGLTFSFDRAFQAPAMKVWAQNIKDDAKAQSVFAQQLQYGADALRGKDYSGNDDGFTSASQS